MHIRERNAAASIGFAAPMPHYFFSFRDGGELRDDMGMDLPDDEAARDEAVRGARSILADTVKDGRLPLSATVGVEDEEGNRLFDVVFKETVEIS